MDIWLSVNNREDIMQIPIMPSSFTVSKSYNNTSFETVNGAEMLLIGEEKLKTVEWSSFFPTERNKKRYDSIAYLKNSSMWGWEYIYKLDTWYTEKLPIRLVITYEHSDTPINIAVTIDSLSYELKQDGELWYSITLKQVNMLGHETIVPWYDEEEIDMEELEKLREQVEVLATTVEALASPMVYNYVDDNMPTWAHEAVEAAWDEGVVSGNGDDGLDLNYDLLRVIVWMYKAGHFKKYNSEEDLPTWAKGAVEAAIEKGVLDADPGEWDLTYSDLRVLVWMKRTGQI